MRLSTVGWFSLFSGERGKRFFWVIAQPLEWESDRDYVEGTSKCSLFHQPCSALKGPWEEQFASSGIGLSRRGETVHGPPQSPSEIPTRQLFTNPRAKECPAIEKALFKFLWRSLLPEVGGEVLKKKENVAQRNGFRVNQDRTKTFCDFLVPHHLCSTVHFHDILFKTNEKPF